MESRDFGILFCIFSGILAFLGLAILCPTSSGTYVLEEVLIGSERLIKGTKWTNGNTVVKILRVYKKVVVYARSDHRGRDLGTCKLSKKVFLQRYSQM